MPRRNLAAKKKEIATTMTIEGSQVQTNIFVSAAHCLSNASGTNLKGRVDHS